MAGGKLSARQKMINLMYLVFIAMLALQMSKKVLSAFGKSSEEMQAAANMKQQSNDYLLQTLETQATDQPKQFKEKYEKAKRIEAKTKEFESYLKKLKDTILNKEFKGNVPDTLDYEAMSNSGTIDEMFFKEGKLLKPAIELKQTIEDYKNFLLSVTDADDIKKNINLRFETNDEKVKGHGVEPWAKANFEGFPTISSVFKLDNYVNKAKETENEIISTMLRGQLISSNKLTNYTTVVKLKKPAYFPGEFVQGRVYLGRTDESMTFNEVVLNGQKLDKEASAKGYVELNFRTAPGLGEKKAKGIMKFIEDGEEKPLDFEVSYTVMPKPKSAVISADKMNVVYRGVKNPMSISFPGVSDNKVKASAPGLVKKGSGSYVLDVTSFKGKEITIKVTGIVDGKSIPASKTFRVKNIPTPLGTVRGESGLVKMPKRNLEMSTIGAALPDFDFDVKLGVRAFDFKVPGQPTVTVRGTRLNAQAKSALRRVKRGQTVQIFNIKAYMKGTSGYRNKKPAPIVIEIVN
jgi:gliding motility-associated protein GldM